jgi:hypothetical protein
MDKVVDASSDLTRKATIRFSRSLPPPPLEEARPSSPTRGFEAETRLGYPVKMPGPKPKVKGKKRKGDASPSASPSSPAAARKGSSAKKSKREEDAPAGVTDSPVDERFAKLPSFNVDIDIESDPEDEADVIDEATLLDHEDDVSDAEGDGEGEDDEEVKAAYDSDFDIDDDADGDDDAGAANDDDATDDGAMDPAEPELFEFNDDGTEKAPGASHRRRCSAKRPSRRRGRTRPSAGSSTSARSHPS